MTEPILDKIHIRDLQLRCIVGIYDEERREKQDVVINIVLHAQISKAGRSDHIKDTVDYKTIKKAVVKLVESSACNLIECLAQQVADTCLAVPEIHRVQVTVDKPNALRFARSVAVEIDRARVCHD